MREIKFRAKRIFDGTIDADPWVYSSQLRIQHDPPRLNLGGVFCEYDTLGQFTGLYDMDGKEIYEGDILKNTKYGHSFHIQWGMPGESYAGWSGMKIGESSDGVPFISPMYNGPIENCKVIGTIHP